MRSSILLLAGCASVSPVLGQTLDLPWEASRDDQLGSVQATGDFNGDGLQDLAIGIPHSDLPFFLCHTICADSGKVYISYGTSSGLSASTLLRDRFDQDRKGIPGRVECGDRFGDVLATGDFNGDGYDDLAIGVPMEKVGSVDYAGAVNVIYGSSAGLGVAGTPAAMFHQDSPGIPDAAERFDWFGSSLAAGDVNQDGYADLAIGVPGESIDGNHLSGMVHLLRGGPAGLSSYLTQAFTLFSPGIYHGGYSNACFGHSLAMGDFDGDEYCDLAVGEPGAHTLDNTSGGVVRLFGGSPHGLKYWWWDLRQGYALPLGNHDCYLSEENDRFGWTLASGDLDGDGFDDIAVGNPDDGGKSMGEVEIVYGGPGLTTFQKVEYFNQDLSYHGDTIPGAREAGDRFGASLAAGDFDGDGKADLAVGVPGETLNPAEPHTGMIQIFNGTAGFLDHRQDAYPDSYSSWN